MPPSPPQSPQIPLTSPTRGIFLDRDGVINQYRTDYVRVEEDFAYYDFVPEAFSILGSLELPIVVVTNQSGIGRGYTTHAIVDAIHARLRQDARGWGAKIGSIEICPHSPKVESCGCRKPGPIMFERAAQRLNIRFEGSYMVGDAPSDMEAGDQLGMITLRVATGRGRESGGPEPRERVSDLLAAARRIAAIETAEIETGASS